MPRNNQKGGAEIVLVRFIEMSPDININDNDNNNILHHVVSLGELKLVQHVLKVAEKKKQLYKILNMYNNDGLTPLHIAVRNNFQDIAEALILYGADPNVPDNNGQKVIYVPEQTGGDNSKIVYGKRYL